MHRKRSDLEVEAYASVFAHVGVAEAISRESQLFSTSHGKLDPAKCLPGMWNDLAYAATTFALAHEAAHILNGKHLLARTNKADEERADGIAFDAAVLCSAWQEFCLYLPAKTRTGKTGATIIGFLYMNLPRLTMNRFLQRRERIWEDALRKRAEHLRLVAGAQFFPDAEKQPIRTC